MSKCPTCGLATRPGAARCELCRCRLPHRRHPRPAFAARPSRPAPPGRPASPNVARFLDELSAELVKTQKQLAPVPPPWLKALAWTMLAGSVASGVALAALLLGLPTP